MSDTIIINSDNVYDSIIINPVDTESSTINIDSGAVAAVVSVNGRVGIVVLNKTDVGLDFVDNTSDLDKPLSNAAISALLLKADLSAFNALDNFIISNSGSWNSATIVVNQLSSNWNSVFDLVNSLSSIEAMQEEVVSFVSTNSSNILQVDSLVNSNSATWDTLFTIPVSSLTYENVKSSNIYQTIQTYAASNPKSINKGSTVELSNGRVYIFAGDDVSNPAHYLEVNTNPITPIYKEISLYNVNEAIVDTFNVSDFKSAKYTLQVETTFNNEIYYSEINIVGSVQSELAVASEYGQISTSNIILGYTANYNVNEVQLIILFSSELYDPNKKIIVKGHRSNFYKI